MRKLLVREPRGELRSIEITRARTLIGRAVGSDVRLAHPQASRLHALLSVNDEGAFLSDLDSANGTYVNGERVAKIRLAHMDRIRVGPCEICYFDDGDDALPPPVDAEVTAR